MPAGQHTQEPGGCHRGSSGVALGIARVAVALVYVVGFYACTFFLPTGVSALVLGLLLVGSCAWFCASLRGRDEQRASHMALVGFLIKVLTLPLEVLVIMVYATLLTMDSYQVVPGMWAVLIALLYLGILGGSLHVIGAAREARTRGLITAGWARILTICAVVPLADLAAGIFLWFALLRQRLLDKE